MSDLNVADDWKFFDWLEDILYSVKIDDEDFAPAVRCSALKRATEKKFDDFASVELSSNRAIWNVWKTSMDDQTIVPKRGDEFVRSSDNTQWIVEAVDYLDRTTRYRLHCYMEQSATDTLDGFLLLETGGGVMFG